MTKRSIYLNHAGTSWPKPQPVVEAVQRSLSSSPDSWAKRFGDAHREIARFFGVQQPDQILLTPGCTSSLAVGLEDVLIENDRRVLTSRWEHHAVHRPLLKMASRGITVEHIPPATGPPGTRPAGLDLDWLEGELFAGDVGLVAITAACNVTGDLLPFDKVIRLAHRFDAMVLIDAAQVVGWKEMDFPNLGADLIAFGGHKGLQGPWGIGGLFLSDRVRMECPTATCTIPTSSADQASQNPRPGYCDVGSVDQIALAGLHAAVDWLSQQDLTANLDRARKQIKKIKSVLETIDGVTIFETSEHNLPTIAFDVSGHSSREVASRLAEHQLVVGSGIQCSPLSHETLETSDRGLVRLSVGVRQPEEEIEEAIVRLQSVFNDELKVG